MDPREVVSNERVMLRDPRTFPKLPGKYDAYQKEPNL
jgi:hypothetical protein